MADLFESVPNFSEGRDVAVMDRLAAAAAGAGEGAFVLDRSFDPDHHRLVLSLTGSAVFSAAFAAVAAAVESIDLRGHAGVHPRLGAADVVPFVPLGSASLEGATLVALAFAERVWSELRVPVHLYGAALGAPSLAAIRSGSPPPFALGDRAHPTAGSVAVGARPLLVAYNLVLNGVDMDSARLLARSLRESAGGVPGIQAMAFPVAAGAQLSMNLTRLGETPPARAREEALRRLPAGGSVASEEVVGLCPAMAAAGCEAADGRLLEARIGAAAARAAAETCAALAASRQEGAAGAGAGPSARRSARGEEMRRLGERLAAEAESLAALPFAEVLAGAERCAALLPVLRAGRVWSEELDALLRVAARGLREAIPTETRQAFPERMAALDARLPPG
jgi:glutamate formiminotransferase